MLKNTQFKIILLFFIVSLIIIMGIEGFFISQINIIQSQIAQGGTENTAEIISALSQLVNKSQICMLIGIGILAMSSILIGVYLSKYMIYPINKLIKSAEQISQEEGKNKKGKISETANLENIIERMTAELQDNLKEVSTQKNQIETILLHMTDGIIAFNREGEIILINPAAKNFLSIRPEDNTFEDIFEKFNLDINMEKIIYLENWTSTEQRIQVEEKYVNVFFAPFKDENERPDGVIAVIQYITEHVKLDNMQKEFVADVSHELKTPITSIMGYADTILEGDYDKETQEKFLNVIASESRRMARLVTDLLTLSRYDNNKNKSKK